MSPTAAAVVTTTTHREKALEAISKLPPFSPVLNKLMASLANDDVGFAEMAGIIEKDTILAGSVLRLVNSAFYARRGTVSSVKYAVAVLGIAKLRNLSMSMSLARMWNSPGLPAGWSSRCFNLHAVASAIMADLIAVELNADYAEGAFTAALLQNVGTVLIAMGTPEEYPRIIEAYQTGAGTLTDYEQGFLDVTHPELSAEVLRRWHLPAPIVEAVANHHGPHPATPAHPLSRMVEMATLMAEQQGNLAQPWMRPPEEGSPADVLASLGLAARSTVILESFQGEFDTIKAFFA